LKQLKKCRAFYMTRRSPRSPGLKGHAVAIRIARSSAGCMMQPFDQGKSKMPKLKTKSGAKKRFKITATGKVMSAHAGKRHGMIKRTTKQIREHRGMTVRFKTDGEKIKKYWLPNG
jgi:large subunit ribosomal protein L35